MDRLQIAWRTFAVVVVALVLSCGSPPDPSELSTESGSLPEESTEPSVALANGGPRHPSLPRAIGYLGGLPVLIDDPVTTTIAELTQAVSITNTTGESITFTPSFNTPQAGITATFSPSMLTVEAGQTQALSFTLTVDHSIVPSPLAPPMTIELSSAAGSFQFSPSLNVKPRLVASSASIDFGINPPSNTQWVSSPLSLSLTNTLIDASQSYTVSASCCTSSSGSSGGSLLASPSSFTVEPGGSATLSLSAALEAAATVAGGRYQGTINLSSALGSLSIPFTFLRGGGVQLDDASASVSILTVDNEAPTAAITSHVGGTVGGTVNVAASASDNVGIARVDLSVDGTVSGSASTAPYQWSWNTVGLADGSTHILRANAYDTAGNLGASNSITLTVDNQAPAVSITSPASGSALTGTITVTASTSDNIGVRSVEFWCHGNFGSAGQNVYAVPFQWSFDTAAYRAGGTLSLVAKAHDWAGNVATSSTVTIIVDNQAPTAAFTSPVSGVAVAGTATITASASDDVGVTRVDLYVDGFFLETKTLAPYQWSWNTSSGSNGNHVLLVNAFDASGKVTSASVSVVVDNVAPTVTITAPTPGAKVGSNKNVTVAVSATDNGPVSSVTVYLNDVPICTDSTSPFSCTFRSMTGLVAYAIRATAIDAAGNTGTSATVNVTTR